MFKVNNKNTRTTSLMSFVQWDWGMCWVRFRLSSLGENKSIVKVTFNPFWWRHTNLWNMIIWMSKIRFDIKSETNLGRPYHVKFFQGCLPQILPGPFLNTLTQMSLHKDCVKCSKLLRISLWPISCQCSHLFA